MKAVQKNERERLDIDENQELNTKVTCMTETINELDQDLKREKKTVIDLGDENMVMKVRLSEAQMEADMKTDKLDQKEKYISELQQ